MAPRSDACTDACRLSPFFAPETVSDSKKLDSVSALNPVIVRFSKDRRRAGACVVCTLVRGSAYNSFAAVVFSFGVVYPLSKHTKNCH